MKPTSGPGVVIFKIKKKQQGWRLKLFPWPIIICLKMAELKFKSHVYKDTFDITTD